MSNQSIRSTVYFDPEIHRSLRLKAASAHRTLSEIVNEAMRQALSDDREDLAVFEQRIGEPTMTYEALLKAIPGDACSRLGLMPGQKLQVMLYQDRIELIPQRSVRTMRGFLKGIGTEVSREEDRA